MNRNDQNFPNTGAGPAEHFEYRLRSLEREVRALRSNRLVSIDRITPDNVPTPVEGQVAVDQSDDQHTWYANGRWRKATAAVSSIHLWTTTSTTFVPNNDTNLGFERVTSYDSTVFTATQSGGKYTRVYCNKQGVYSVFMWLDWGDYTGLVKTTLYNLNNVDTVATFGQTTVHDTGTHVTVPPMCAYTRTIPDEYNNPFDTIPTWHEFWVNQDSSSNRDTNIAYWEVMYHGVTDY